MAKHITQLDPSTGKVVTGRAPRRARQVDLPVTIVNTRGKRFWRDMVG